MLKAENKRLNKPNGFFTILVSTDKVPKQFPKRSDGKSYIHSSSLTLLCITVCLEIAEQLMHNQLKQNLLQRKELIEKTILKLQTSVSLILSSLFYHLKLQKSGLLILILDCLSLDSFLRLV
jgi:hypothetical protein